MNNITVGSFFAGVGGIDLAFKNAGFNVVYANEIDPYPAKTYNENFTTPVDIQDISNVSGKTIPNFDVMVGGFPCQAFSIAGRREGFNDSEGRGELFFEMTRIIEEKKQLGHQPSVVFFENVKNLVSHDKGNTFTVIKETLERLGYSLKWEVLNASQYGNLPQNRERIYIVGFLNEKQYNSFSFPKPIERTKTVKECLTSESVPQKYYYTESFYAYPLLVESMVNPESVYQWRRKYVRENKSGLCPTLTANMGTGGHNVPLIVTSEGGFRKLTPRECFNLQGFPETFTLPESISDSRLYKQAGNSVAVPVVERIADSIRTSITIFHNEM